MSSKGKKPAGKSAIDQVVAREYTIHLHKRVRFQTRTATITDDRMRRKSRKRPTDWATKTWKENEVLTDYFFLQLHGASFKKRAPKAIKEIKDFAQKAMVRTPEFRVLHIFHEYTIALLHLFLRFTSARRCEKERELLS